MRKLKNLCVTLLMAALVLLLPASAAMAAPEEEPLLSLIPAEKRAENPLLSLLPTEEPEASPPPVAALSEEELANMVLPLPTSAAVEVQFPRSPLASAVLLRTAPVMTLSRAEGDHISYLSGINGNFCPERVVTRRELAQVLSVIVTDLPVSVTALYDVAWDDDDAAVIQKAVGLDLLSAPDGFFRPADPATRAECAWALSWLLPYGAEERVSFPDVAEEYWAWDAISRCGGFGLFAGDGSVRFNPEEPVRRYELAVLFNRVLGRGTDQGFVARFPAFQFFPDVPASHVGYWDILEATVPHQSGRKDDGGECWLWAGLKFEQDGPFRANRRLYYVQNGEFVREEYVGYLYFDAYGRYTTGNARLDVRLNNIIEWLTNDGMNRDQKLRALFNYLRDNYTYLKRPLISKGQTGWEPDYALFFLNNGKGNCYCFSAAYCLLCRNLGLQAYTVVGRALNSPHGWVEIKLDGAVYLFDTQLEWRYLHDWGRQGYNFFKQPYNNTTVVYSR